MSQIESEPDVQEPQPAPEQTPPQNPVEEPQTETPEAPQPADAVEDSSE